METTYVPDKPIYRCGAYKWLNRDETMCTICSAAGNPKILRTAKHSYTTLVSHIKMHPVQQQKFFELSEGAPPSIRCSVPYSELRPQLYEPAQRPNDDEYEPAPLSNQELLNHALSAVLNGASGISSSFTSSSSDALNGLDHGSSPQRQRTAKEEEMDESGVTGTTESFNGTADVAGPKDDLHAMTLDQLKEEVLRSEIRRNLSEERRNHSEERRNMAMARFFNRLADRI